MHCAQTQLWTNEDTGWIHQVFYREYILLVRYTIYLGFSKIVWIVGMVNTVIISPIVGEIVRLEW